MASALIMMPMLGKAALLVVPFALIALDVQASPECMTKQEARAKWPAKPIYLHGSSRCWNDQPLSSRPSTTSAANASDSVTKTLALALPVPRPKPTKTEIFFPSVVVKNMSGAGGLQAARHLNEAAPRDGTTIGGLSRALIFEPLLGKNVAQVDYRKFGWLGSMSQSTAVYVSWKGRSKIETAQDLFTQELLIAGTGAAAETTIITTAINGIVGTRIKLVQGYAGSVAGLLALERGEVDGGFPTMEALKTVHPDWLRDGKLNLLFQTRQTPDPEIASVPTVISYLAVTEAPPPVVVALAFEPTLTWYLSSGARPARSPTAVIT